MKMSFFVLDLLVYFLIVVKYADIVNCPNRYSSTAISKCAKAGNEYVKITYMGIKMGGMNMDFEKEINEIKERNQKVELNKAWETSWTRKIFIMVLTYIVVLLYSLSIDKINNIFLNSLVPVIGFTLSTVSLNLIRKIWEIFR